MADKVKKVGIEKEKGYLYYLDKNGDIARSKMARGSDKGGNAEVVKNTSVTREKGFLYYIDKDGDISKSPIARR
ncbi:MAG: hypothetical protein H8E60_04080 [Candidatus Marinimicrobia bacterium]|nr:hypothetical protein [Candidatus Neomarinimicrobiota bacterium]